MKRLVAVLITLVCFIPVHAETAGSSDTSNPNQIIWQEPNPDDLVLLEVYIERYNLNEVIQSYHYNNRFYIPLTALSQTLGIAIQANTEMGTAEGYIFKDNRRFWLDAKNRQVTVGGQTTTYPEGEVVVYPDDIYVTAEQLSEWFPYTLDIDLNLSVIIVNTAEKFPYQQRLEREQKMKHYRQRYVQPKLDYPQQPFPYAQYSVPFIDQNLSLSMVNTPTVGYSANIGYINYATMDVFHQQGEMYLALNNTTGVESFRFTLGRKDPDGKLLGGMNATEYSYGYVVFNGNENTALAHNSTIGVSASSYPLTQQLNYDTHTFRGRLLPGWQVELYQNDSLVGFVTENSTTTNDTNNKQYFENGEYVFADVPLIFGNNYFKLVFYGPHGEVIEEKHNYLLSPGLIRKGQQYYRFAMGVDDSNQGQYIQGRYDIGLSKNFTLNTHYESLPFNGIQHNYYSIGTASFFRSLFLRMSYTGDTVGGNMQDIHLQTRVWFMNIGYHQASLNNFTSEVYSTSPATIGVRDIRLDTAIPKGIFPRIPLVMELNETSFADGSMSREVSTKFSINYRTTSIVNELTYSDSVPTLPYSGMFQMSHYKNGQGLRGEIYYGLEPFALTSVVVNYFGRYLAGYRMNFSISNTSTNDMQYVFGATKTRGQYSFTGQFSYTTNGEYALTASMSMNLARNPETQKWQKRSTPVASKGSLSILVFYDANQNGVRDPGEEGIANAGFILDGSRRAYRTDASGHVFITGLTVYKKMSVAIDLNTLDDPLWLPAVEGYSIVLRPGATGVIEIPINTTGELDGVVFLQRGGKQIPLSGVDVQLVDMDGNVIQTVKTAYDGYYVISRVPVGQYIIRIAPEQLAKNGLEKVPDRRVKLSVQQLFLNGNDFVLRRSG